MSDFKLKSLNHRKFVFPLFQVFALSLAGELRREEGCFDAVGKAEAKVELMTCHGMRGNQLWTHEKVSMGSARWHRCGGRKISGFFRIAVLTAIHLEEIVYSRRNCEKYYL